MSSLVAISVYIVMAYIVMAYVVSDARFHVESCGDISRAVSDLWSKSLSIDMSKAVSGCSGLGSG